MKKAKIEVFKAGRYGQSEGRIWSTEEVQQLASNYDPTYRNAPIILGHNDWNGEKPAYGWVDSFSMDEYGILHADIEYNDELGGMIKQKMYTRVSIEATKKIELYDTLEGKQGAYVLAVALLGGSQPAVSGLSPVKFNAEDKINAETLENSIEVFTSEDKNEKDEQPNENGEVVVPKNSDTIIDEVEDKSTETKQEEYNVTKEELEKFNSDKESFAKEQEVMNAEKEALAKEKEEFALVGKKNEISAFMTENSKRITPAMKNEVEVFMVGLSDEQMESFKKIVVAIPENEVFNKMDEEKNKNENIDSDEKFQKQAQQDIADARKK